jgi:membrane fusion protein (multidrug efflux system)
LLTTVSQIDPVRVRFPISERDYLQNARRWRELSGHDLKWAQAQFAKFDAEPAAAGNEAVEMVLADGKTYGHRGVVVATDREVDPSTGTIQVEALFPNPEGILRPGLYARLRMRREGSGESSVVVAQRALLEVQGTYSVAVVGKGNKVELRRVEVGPSSGEERVITKGVVAGERIVVEGVQKVSDGALVVPQAAPPVAPEARVKSARLGS